MNTDNSQINKYILIDTSLRSPYAKISSAKLSNKEAKVKNYAFAINKVNKKYILEKDWK
jgi:hypothetical protein